MVQHFAHKTLSQHRNMHQQHIQSKICFYFVVFQVKLLCFNKVPPNMKCPILKLSTNVPYLKICKSFDTTSNTFDSVIFISKVLIILMRDFELCFTSAASVHASIVSIAFAMFATVFPTPEMIVMNTNEWRIRSCRLRNSLLPMRTCAILCWQFQ